MPEDFKPLNHGMQALDPAQNNAEVKAKLEAQGAEHVPADPTDTLGALDELAKKQAEERAAATPEAEAQRAEEAEAAKKAADEVAAKAAQTDTERAATEEAAKKSAAEAEVVKAKGEELFKDTPQLPAGASPKSHEAFSTIKIKAAQEISSREAKIEELTKQLAERDEKLKNPLTPEIEKELNDLREFRAKLDVEADPKFKEFDKSITSTQDFIYAQLKKSPAVTEDVIKEIKKYGGPEMVNLTKLWEKIADPTMQRIVESRVAEIEQQKFLKQQAIDSTKKNVGEYVKAREEQFKGAATAHNTATKAELDAMLAKMEWLKEKPIDEKADEKIKKSLSEENKFLSEVHKNMQLALNDDSSQMRAIMVAGMGQFLFLQRAHAIQGAQLKVAEKTIGELQGKLDAIKSSSTTRLREGGAAPGAKIEVKKDEDEYGFTKQPGQALDDLARKIMEERQKAANS